MSRPSRILIDLNALHHNLSVAQQLCGTGKIAAVIKADAYGHGALEVAFALQDKIELFAVSSLQEALELRNSGIANDILLLEGCFSFEEYRIALHHKFQIVVHSEHQLAMMESYPVQADLKIWLKIETGMHRLGIEAQQANEFYQRLINSPTVGQVLMMTHLAAADNPDTQYSTMQLERFENALSSVNQSEREAFACSIANSAAMLLVPSSRREWNRPGFLLYGLSPLSQPNQTAEQLIPVMTFESEIIALAEVQKGELVGYAGEWRASQNSRIATVAAGYGDGYPLNAKSGTPVLVNGQRATLVGRVSMDMIMVDVTAIPDAAIGARVELWGKNLLASEVARYANTSAYELVTRMTKRLPRKVV